MYKMLSAYDHNNKKPQPFSRVIWTLCVLRGIPVMLIGTTSAWTAWACRRIFSSGVGKGRDWAQLVWVLWSGKSLEVGVLGLLMEMCLSSSEEEIEPCRGDETREATVCKELTEFFFFNLNWFEATNKQTNKNTWPHLGTEAMVCKNSAQHPEHEP